MKNIFVWMFCLVFFSCCNVNTKEKSNIKPSVTRITVDSDWEAEPGLKLSDIVEKVDFVQLETTDNCLLREIEKVEVWKEFIYVLEKPAYRSSGVYQFDKRGKFIRRIGTKGEGPTEFIEMTDFSINSETGNVYIYDAVRMVLFEYQDDGAIVRNLRVGYRGDKMEYSDGLLYFYEYSPGDDGVSTDKLYIIDLDGNMKAHYSPGLNAKVRFGSAGFSRIKDEKLLCYEVYNDTIYSFDKENISAKYVFDFGKYAMTNNAKFKYFEALKDDQKLEQCQLILRNNIVAPGCFIETNNWLFLTIVLNSIQYICAYDKSNEKMHIQTSFIDDMYSLFSFLITGAVGKTDSELIASNNSNAIISSIERVFPKKVNSGEMTLNKCDSLTNLFSRYLPIDKEKQKNALNGKMKEKKQTPFEEALAAMYGDREDELNPILIFIKLKE